MKDEIKALSFIKYPQTSTNMKAEYIPGAKMNSENKLSFFH